MTTNKEKIDPRVIRTRKLLQDALLSLVSEKNFDSLTIQDITDRATLNRVTFYLHYDNKFDLLQDASKAILDDLVSSYEAQNIFKSPDHFRSIIRANFEHIKKYSSFYKSVLGRDGVLPFIRSLEDYMYNRNRDNCRELLGGEPENALDEEIALRSMVSGFIELSGWWLAKDQPFSPEEMADKLLLIFQEGFYRALVPQVNESWGQ